MISFRGRLLFCIDRFPYIPQYPVGLLQCQELPKVPVPRRQSVLACDIPFWQKSVLPCLFQFYSDRQIFHNFLGLYYAHSLPLILLFLSNLASLSVAPWPLRAPQLFPLGFRSVRQCSRSEERR